MKTTLVPVLLGVAIVILGVIPGCGGGGVGGSPPTPGLTQEQALQYWNAGGSGASRYAQLSGTEPADQARTETVAGLKATAGVSDAGVTPDGTTVWFKTDSGAAGYIVTDLSDLGGGTTAPAGGGDKVHSASTSTVRGAVTGPPVFESPNPGPALLMNAWDMEPDGFRNEKQALMDMGYASSEVTVLPSAAVTRAWFQGIAQYSVVEFYGHGRLSESGAPVLLLREPCPDDVALQQTYRADTPLWWDGTAGTPNPDYTVTAPYVKSVGGNFRRSVVVLNACYSMNDSSFAACFGSTCLTLGWANEVAPDTANAAAEYALSGFGQQHIASQVRTEWAMYHDLNGADGQSAGSNTVCLVANLVGSWLGPMSPAPRGDPNWGMRITRYDKDAVEGTFAMDRLQDCTFSSRGLRCTGAIVGPAPDATSGPFEFVVTSDDKLYCNGPGPGGVTISWQASRVSPGPDYDTTAPVLVGFSPPSGTVPREFEMSLKWSEPMGNWWSTDAVTNNGDASFTNWRYDVAARTTLIHVRIVPLDSELPCSMTFRVHHYCDIWGNWCSDPAAVINYQVP